MGLRLEVAYGDAAALRHDYESQLSVGGLYARVAPPPGVPPLAPVEVVLEEPQGASIRLAGRLTVATADAFCVEILPSERGDLALWIESVCAGAAADPAGGRSVRLVLAGEQPPGTADRPVPGAGVAAPRSTATSPPGIGAPAPGQAATPAPGIGAPAPGQTATPAPGDRASAAGAADATVSGCESSGPLESGPGPRPRRSGIPGSPSPAADRGGLPLARRIELMSVAEKVHLARHGERDARALLSRDRAGVVQCALVANPRMGSDEIVALARNPQLAAECAEALAQHPSHGRSPEVAYALCRNPRTPLPLVYQLIPRLNPNDLRVLAKGLGVRTQVAQAARKRLFGG